VQWGFCPRQLYCALWDANQERPARRGLIGIVETPSMRRLMRPVPPITASRECSFRNRQSLISRVAIAAGLFLQSKELLS